VARKTLREYWKAISEASFNCWSRDHQVRLARKLGELGFDVGLSLPKAV
jgi:hypothetical protein